ncbi:uncharacterized protein LOC129040106 [Pongo pygmaeus]|uniref:uncharacterized protein LOC129040106 n=1 Tax=Pongo pygmaeus TaxID=9600 RepID=UPI00300CE09A
MEMRPWISLPNPMLLLCEEDGELTAGCSKYPPKSKVFFWAICFNASGYLGGAPALSEDPTLPGGYTHKLMSSDSVITAREFASLQQGDCRTKLCCRKRAGSKASLHPLPSNTHKVASYTRQRGISEEALKRAVPLQSLACRHVRHAFVPPSPSTMIVRPPQPCGTLNCAAVISARCNLPASGSCDSPALACRVPGIAGARRHV